MRHRACPFPARPAPIGGDRFRLQDEASAPDAAGLLPRPALPDLRHHQELERSPRPFAERGHDAGDQRRRRGPGGPRPRRSAPARCGSATACWTWPASGLICPPGRGKTSIGIEEPRCSPSRRLRATGQHALLPLGAVDALRAAELPNSRPGFVIGTEHGAGEYQGAVQPSPRQRRRRLRRRASPASARCPSAMVRAAAGWRPPTPRSRSAGRSGRPPSPHERAQDMPMPTRHHPSRPWSAWTPARGAQ